MRSLVAYSAFLAVLAGPVSGADVPVQAAITSRVEVGEGLTNRLSVKAEGPLRLGAVVLLTWIGWRPESLPNRPTYRAAASVAGIQAGPIVLTGALRELSDSHRVSARNTAPGELTSARLDRSMSPTSRTGIVVTPATLPVRATAYTQNSGRVVALSAFWPPKETRAAESRDVHAWTEATVVFSRPEPPARDLLTAGWFDLSGEAADTVHIALRRSVPDPAGEVQQRLASGLGVSVSPVRPPGWWMRLVIGSGPMTGLDARITATGLITSVHHAPLLSAPRGDAAALAVRLEAGGHDHIWMSAGGGLCWNWHPRAATPGTPFTIHGLCLTSATADLSAVAQAAAWQWGAHAAIDVTWWEPSDASSGRGKPHGDPVLSPELRLKASRDTPTGDGAVRQSELSVGLDDSGAGFNLSGRAAFRYRLAGNRRFQLGFTLGGEAGCATGQTVDELTVSAALAECEAELTVRAGTLRGEASFEWRAQAQPPIAWRGSFGWTASAATDEE